jgi:hypothetical protein
MKVPNIIRRVAVAAAAQRHARPCLAEALAENVHARQALTEQTTRLGDEVRAILAGARTAGTAPARQPRHNTPVAGCPCAAERVAP